MPTIEESGGRGGLSITDVPGHAELLDNVKSSFELCRRQNGLEAGDIGLANVYVVGSYARDRATKGESDIDLVVEYENVGEQRLTPEFDLDQSIISGCMREDGELITSGFEEWFDGTDIIATNTINKWSTLLRFTSDTRDNPSGIRRVYWLDKRKYLSKEEISQRGDVRKMFEQSVPDQ